MRIDREKWEQSLKRVKQRPAMFIGNQERGHLIAIGQPIRLVWEAKAFQEAQSACIHISPHQFVVICKCGALLKPLQKMVHFVEIKERSWTFGPQLGSFLTPGSRGHELDPAFSASERDTIDVLTSAVGPSLSSPFHPWVLSRCFVGGMRTDEGLWVQVFDSIELGSELFLVDEPSPVGLVTAAELDLEWFTGLPFSPDVASQWISRRPIEHDWNPQTNKLETVEWVGEWPEVPIIWHPKDELITAEALSPSGFVGWLASFLRD